VVVGEVVEAVPDALDLLDEQVDRLGGPLEPASGGVEGEDLGLPRPHRCEPAGKAPPLGRHRTTGRSAPARREPPPCWPRRRRPAAAPCLARPRPPLRWGSPAVRRARSRARPVSLSCSAAVRSSLRMRYSGSRLRLRCPRVACCTRQRPWSTTILAAGWRGKWSTTTLRPRVETGGGSPARFGHRARPGGDPAERLKNRRRASGGVFWLPWDFAPRKELGSQRLSGSNAALSPKQRKLIWA